MRATKSSPRTLALFAGRRARWASGALAVVLAGCAATPPAPSAPAPSPAESKALIARLLPRNVADPSGWATDIYAAFAVQGIAASRENICAVVGVTEQESGFRTDPAVAGLPKIAWAEIDRRAERAGLPRLVVHAALQLPSPTGASYSERLDQVRTEKDLSDVFQDFIGMVPMGQKLFSGANPVHTRGPMQVSVDFAQRHAAGHPYPYPVKTTLADELFTRRGGLWFGTAHLLGYPAGYDRFVYRFADYNAGQYSSRNAAFQSALSTASGIPLALDGAPLSHDEAAASGGSTEIAARAIAARLDLGAGEIRRALEQSRSAEFERTPLYERVFALADRVDARRVPRALIPRIDLQSPKITRPLTTEWFANRVDERFRNCLAR